MDWKKFLLSFDGRIGRKAFWLFFVASLVLLASIDERRGKAAALSN